MINNWLNLMNLSKNDFNIDRDSIQLEKQKKYLMNLLKKDLLLLEIQKKELILKT